MNNIQKVRQPLRASIVAGYTFGTIDLFYDLINGPPEGFRTFYPMIPVFIWTVLSIGLLYFFSTVIFHPFESRITMVRRLFISVPTALPTALFVILLIISQTAGLTYFPFFHSYLFQATVISFIIASYIYKKSQEKFASVTELMDASVTALPFVSIIVVSMAWVMKFYEISSRFLVVPLVLITAGILSASVKFNRRWTSRPLMLSLGLTTTLILLGTIVLITATITPCKGYAKSKKRVPRVFLLSIDALRSDALSCYNPDSLSKTPAIDAIAADGILFNQAISAAPWTLPSFASLMTGMTANIHGTINFSTALPDNFTTIAEYLKKSGYYTGAVVTNQLLREKFNINQGFADYSSFPRDSFGDSNGAQILYYRFFKNFFKTFATTEEMTGLTKRWLDQYGERNTFFWLHYFDPHLPYAPPKQYIAGAKIEPRIGTEFDKLSMIRTGHLVPTKKEKEWIRFLYAAEVKYVDDNIGNLIKYLKNKGWYDDSLLLILSDHGEEFWDHGGFEHGHTIYNELLHVPLIVKLPKDQMNMVTERIVKTSVSLQSVLPTILDICGISYNRKLYQYPSLTPLWGNKASSFPETPIYSTTLLYYENREAIAWQNMKYIRFTESDKEELYNIEKDKRETTNLESTDLHSKIQGKQLLDEQNRLDRTSENSKNNYAKKVNLDTTTLEQLRALGYVP